MSPCVIMTVYKSKLNFFVFKSIEVPLIGFYTWATSRFLPAKVTMKVSYWVKSFNTIINWC